MNKIQCNWCGRFISYKDLDENKATTEFTPDSHFGPEVIEHTCKKCNEEDDKLNG